MFGRPAYSLLAARRMKSVRAIRRIGARFFLNLNQSVTRSVAHFWQINREPRIDNGYLLYRRNRKKYCIVINALAPSSLSRRGGGREIDKSNLSIVYSRKRNRRGDASEMLSNDINYLFKPLSSPSPAGSVPSIGIDMASLNVTAPHINPWQPGRATN